jgi:hypothetical protein
MNRTSDIIHCKPSQLVNLRYLPGVLIAVALLFVPKAFLSEIIPVSFFAGKICLAFAETAGISGSAGISFFRLSDIKSVVYPL